MAKFSVAIQSNAIQTLINNTLGDKGLAKKFIAEVSTAVSNNSQLALCDANTIINAGLIAHSVNLSLAPALSYCYIIPYKGRATFQISYKGLIQLALRTNQYKEIDAKVVHQGEWQGRDEFGNDIIKWNYECDNNPVVGYYAYFILTNGFVKKIYWTKEMCEKHAKTYSVQYATKGTGKWAEMFDTMALKTVLKQLLSKWGILSTELEQVIQADQAVVRDNGTFDYVDNQFETETKTEIDIPKIPTSEDSVFDIETEDNPF